MGRDNGCGLEHAVGARAVHLGLGLFSWFSFLGFLLLVSSEAQHSTSRTLLHGRQEGQEPGELLAGSGAGKVLAVPAEEAREADFSGLSVDAHVARVRAEGGDCAVEGVVDAARRVDADGGATLGAADESKVDAWVHHAGAQAAASV